eukprot:UN27601
MLVKKISTLEKHHYSFFRKFWIFSRKRRYFHNTLKYIQRYSL